MRGRDRGGLQIIAQIILNAEIHHCESPAAANTRDYCSNDESINADIVADLLQAALKYRCLSQIKIANKYQKRAHKNRLTVATDSV